MWAWRKHRGNLEPIWEEVAVPRPHPTGLLVKLIAAGVCRSDHNLLTNENQPAWFSEKFTLGHEGCGRIVELGADVSSSAGFKVGDVIAMLALCTRARRSGIGNDGFYASYCVVDVRGAVHVPPGVTPSQAAVATDAVTTAYHAIHRRGKITSKDVVFLFGLGGLGFNALQVIRAIGAKVLVSDVKQENLDDAVKIGVDVADTVPVGKDIKDWVEKNGWSGRISIVADFVGTAQTFSDAQHIVRQAGRLLCVGTLNHENIVHMKIAIRKRLDITFSYGGQIRDLKEALDLISSGVLDPVVVDGKLEEFPRTLKELEAGKIKGRVSLLIE
ncbi:hypothetical protein E8E13_008353 [Curvularia kusanoi]|uniref:Enoyl reductase (ER) domain-containing protein n=1 Tax=Curvularia kusanoi TaxID=90978 RepID=A0A9P4WAU4_CURKU|nr:hypothetical protein E8E13_008353 [Curvularia kusanoi]